ncbi:hypothetical protein [Actinokineospora inagensis]|uniref:hypothetical protein n=1 Tax=Actinokineospora inagensis TaxID=103730 RepID=UPI0003F59C53|nr:hypothetical protein [Actinokineospora inagensis]
MSVTRPVVLPRFTVRVAVPIGVLVVLAGVLLLATTIAPSMVDREIYQVVLQTDGDETGAVIPYESLDCTRQDATATCTTKALGTPLQLTMTYLSDNAMEAKCSAVYKSEPFGCEAMIGDYGHESSSAFLRVRELGLTTAQLDQVNADLPWWRDGEQRDTAVFVIVGGLALVAALVSGFAAPRPADEPRLLVWTVGVGWVLLVTCTGILLAPRSMWNPGSLLLFANPVTMLPGGLLMYWQWTQAQPGRTAVGRAAGSFAVTAVVSGIALFLLQLTGGFID